MTIWHWLHDHVLRVAKTLAASVTGRAAYDLIRRLWPWSGDQRKLPPPEQIKRRRRRVPRKERWRKWAMYVRRQLRRGIGNRWTISADEEEAALWAQDHGLIELEEWGPELLACLPGHRIRGLSSHSEC